MVIKSNKKLKLSFFAKIFILTALVIIFVITTTMLSTQYYIRYLDKKIENGYKNSLNQLRDFMDKILFDTYSKAIDYAWSDDLNAIRNSIDYSSDFINGYKPFIQSDYYIHDVFYLDFLKKIAITKDGVKNLNYFFKYHYENIFYKDIPVLSFDTYFYLISPVEFRVNELSYATVIPYLIPDKGNLNKMILINIDLQKITYFMKQNLLSSDSNILMLDENGNIITNTDYSSFPNRSLKYNVNFPYNLPENYVFNPAGKNFLKKINNKYFLDKIKKQKVFSYNGFNGNRLILSSVSQQNSFNKIYYVATIPYSKIYKQSFTMPVSMVTILIFLICLIISLLFTFFSSKYLYKPIKVILKKFNINVKNNKSGDNEFKLISDNIQKLLDDKDDLDQKYKNILPIISENFIFNFLNSNLDITENDFNEFINKNNIILDKKFFLVAVIRFDYMNDFYKIFNHEKQLDIINQTRKLIINIFKNILNIYILSLNKNELCVILNFEEKINLDSITEKLNNIILIFEEEKKYINISIGIGSIHHGLNGLKSSYNESYQTIATILPYDDKKIKIYNPSTIDQYSYTLNEENGLINYLLCGFEEESINLINAIIKMNKKNNLSYPMEKELYLRIYYSCLRALSLKDISIKDLMGNEYIDIPKIINSLSINNLNDYLLKIVTSISAISNYKGRFEIDEIIDYINQNFSRDFSIEYIADKYKISIPHLSRLLKKRLGTSFQQYVNKCRISKAKDLLLKTSKGLDEISLECGFNSRFTFLRMFKILEKITPSQYKTINKKN